VISTLLALPILNDAPSILLLSYSYFRITAATCRRVITPALRIGCADQ
jgi:hypothetical protein